MEERTQSTETKIRRDVPLEDLHGFCSGMAEVADDIIGESGGILLPRGTPLSSLASSIDKIFGNVTPEKIDIGMKRLRSHDVLNPARVPL